MKKAWFLSLALTLTLTLTACGNSDAALRQENEALRQQNFAGLELVHTYEVDKLK